MAPLENIYNIGWIFRQGLAGQPGPANSGQGALITSDAELLENFDELNYGWQQADWVNEDPSFLVAWHEDNASVDKGILTLILDKQGCPDECNEKAYASGEYRSTGKYGYGTYEVRMKAAKGNGLITSFFIFSQDSTQNSDKDKDKNDTSHDEIDFEFLGNDTTRVQVNYFVKGQGKHEFMIDLGFDASKEFHNYGIKWTKDAIIWYIDGVEKHRTLPGADIPEEPGHIIANLWASNDPFWAGRFHYNKPASAEYQWIKHNPLVPGSLKAVSRPYLPCYSPKAMNGPSPVPDAKLTPIASPETAEPVSNEEPAQLASRQEYCGLDTINVDALPEINIVREEMEADTSIGVSNSYTCRSQIDIRKAAKILSIEQVEETLQIIASTNPDKILNPNASNLPLEETEKAYPEFTHLLAIDAKYEHKLFRYLLDFRDYWNNAISLLAVYIQLAVENNDQQRLQRGLDLVKFFRQRIKAQKDLTEKFDAATTDPDVRNQVYGREYIPSEYHQALLDLTEAEVLSFYKDQKTSFYQAGIDLAENAIHVMMSLKDKPFFESQPDYFSIAKGLLVMGDLYSKMKKYDLAEKCYNAITAKGIFYPGLSEIARVSKEKIQEALIYNEAKGFIVGSAEDYDNFLVPFASLRVGENILMQANKSKGKKRIALANKAYVHFTGLLKTLPEGTKPLVRAQALIRLSESYLATITEKRSQDFVMLQVCRSDVEQALELIDKENKQSTYFFYFAKLLLAKIIIEQQDLNRQESAFMVETSQLNIAYEMLMGIPKEKDFELWAWAVIERNSIVAQYASLYPEKIELEWDKLDEIIGKLDRDSYFYSAACVTRAELLIARADRSPNALAAKADLDEARQYLAWAKKRLDNDEYLFAKASILHAGIVSRFPIYYKNEINDMLKLLPICQAALIKGTYLWHLAEILKAQLLLAKADVNHNKIQLKEAKETINNLSLPNKFDDLYVKARLLQLSLIARDPEKADSSEVQNALAELELLKPMVLDDDFYTKYNIRLMRGEFYLILADKEETSITQAVFSNNSKEYLEKAALLLNPKKIPEETGYLHDKAVVLYASIVARQKSRRKALEAKGELALLYKELDEAINNLRQDDPRSYLLALGLSVQGEFLIQQSEVKGMAVAPMQALLVAADRSLQDAKRITEEDNYLYAKIVVMQGAVYSRYPTYKSIQIISDYEKEIEKVSEKFRIGSYYKAFAYFTRGQLILALANRNVDVNDNLSKAAVLFENSNISWLVDSYLYAAACVKLLEINTRQARYVRVSLVKTPLLNKSYYTIAPTEEIKKTEELYELAKSAVAYADKAGEDVDIFKAQMELFDLTIRMTKTKERQKMIDKQPGVVGPLDLIATVDLLPEPLRQVYNFEMRLKEAALCIERAHQYESEKNEHLEAAFKLLTKLETEVAAIEKYGDSFAWDTSYLKAELYYLLATYYAMKNIHNGIVKKDDIHFIGDARKDQIWKALIRKGYIDEKGNILKQFIKDKMVITLNKLEPPLSSWELASVAFAFGTAYLHSARSYAYNAYITCDQSPARYTHDLLVWLISHNTGITRKKLKLPPRIHKTIFEDKIVFAKRDDIWESLKRNGYIDECGIVQKKFDPEHTERFKLDINLNDKERFYIIFHLRLAVSL